MNETLHEMAVRMSGGRCGKGCAGCPACTKPTSLPCLICCLSADNADAQLDALRKWAEEHPLPKRTWLDMFNDTFPNALRRVDKAPHTCPDVLYGSVAENRDCRDSCYDGDCFDCWNREATEE